MNKFNRLTLINTLLLLVLIVFGAFYLIDNSKQEVVYVDNIKLFNDFNMTKNIRTIEEAKINAQQRQLDSLVILLKRIENIESDVYKNTQKLVINKNEDLQDLQENYLQNLSSNVWNRLNSYIKEYAKNNRLKIVLGTNGNGNIMFAQKSIDITNQILEFSNLKYEGNN